MTGIKTQISIKPIDVEKHYEFGVYQLREAAILFRDVPDVIVHCLNKDHQLLGTAFYYRDAEYLFNNQRLKTPSKRIRLDIDTKPTY